VRQLTSGDDALLDAAVRLFRGVLVLDHDPFLADPASVAFVAIDGQELVGWVWGLRQRHVCGYTQVQLYEIEVSEPARGRGIGRDLLTAFRDAAILEGHRRMWLFTDLENRVAKRLYESAGGRPSAHDDAGYWWQLQQPVLEPG
jgi:ribosomal protein S18 acetylase RimI-like enzyme